MPDLVLRYEARVNALKASSFHYIDEGVLQEYTLGKLERNYIRDRNVVSQISFLAPLCALSNSINRRASQASFFIAGQVKISNRRLIV